MSLQGTVQNGTVVIDALSLLPDGTRVEITISGPELQSWREEAISLEEFDRILDEITAQPMPVKSLPIDFSRADIYADHD